MNTSEFSKFLFVCKKSRWQIDLLHYGSEELTKRIYRQQNDAFPHIYDSHLRQIESINMAKNFFRDATFTTLDQLSTIALEQYQLIISLGGDNHFVHVAHKIFPSQKFQILGVNSDPLTSTGALLSFSVSSLINFVQEKGNNFPIEYWSLISGQLTTVLPEPTKEISLAPCISEISIHSKNGDAICRLLVRKNQETWEDIKCTGLLVSTGTGSSGWFSNCFCDNRDHSFAKDADTFMSIVREPPYAKRAMIANLCQQYTMNDVLEIISKVDASVVIDSYPKYSYPFPAGSKLHFRLAQQKLSVATANLNSNS